MRRHVIRYDSYQILAGAIQIFPPLLLVQAGVTVRILIRIIRSTTKSRIPAIPCTETRRLEMYFVVATVDGWVTGLRHDVADLDLPGKTSTLYQVQVSTVRGSTFKFRK